MDLNAIFICIRKSRVTENDYSIRNHIDVIFNPN